MRIFPLGDSALTVDFGSVISPELNAKAIGLAGEFAANRFTGFIEAAAAYTSVTVFYDSKLVRSTFTQFPSAFTAVSEIARLAAQNASDEIQIERRTVSIPIDCGAASSLDIEQVSEFSGLSGDEVIDLFMSRTYRVYMLGFLPGFAYMGEVDERIAAPRLDAPRTKVPKGSVGIAGKQTGIYPLESPGGWNIIGRTSLEMFDPASDRPCLLRPGDEVRFVRV